MADLEAELLAYLAARDTAVTTAQVARDTGHTKLVINQTLYALLGRGQVRQAPGIPPHWSIVAPLQQQEPSAAAEPSVVVVVDLGCCHDVLPNVLPYAQRAQLKVCAFADVAFNGFGVMPRPDCSNFTLWHATTADKNSADVALIWDVSRMALQLSAQNFTFLYAPKTCSSSP